MEPDRTRLVIAMMIIIGFLAVIAAWFVFPIKGDSALFNVLVGMLGTSFGGVVSFYFASTSGSKAKDATISTIASSTIPAAPAAPTPSSNVATLGRTGP
jgi:uncharacterized membrane protein YeaQ/YmgE (transglycosylase-associated protein family)